MWEFHSTDKRNIEPGKIEVPYLEDARADFAPYYSSTISVSQAKQEVTAELSKLGVGRVDFQSGYFTLEKLKRHGFVIRFHYRGAPALIRVAGLPIKHQETRKKIDQVQVQALLNVRDWLKAAVTSPVFTPGVDIFTVFMLADESRGLTIGDLINMNLESGRFPHLPPPSDPDDDVVDGDYFDGE